MPPVYYAMVTVKLGHPQVDRQQAFDEVKTALGLKYPMIDESYGAIPMGKGDEYVVLIDAKLAQKMLDEKHPNVTGVFANPNMEPFSPPTAKRRPPGMSGPCF